MNTENLNLKELSLEEMEETQGGFWVAFGGVLAGAWALTGLYDWGYEYALRKYEQA